MARAQADLLAVMSPPMETNVPASAQSGTVRLKDALVSLTDSILAEQAGTASAKQVNDALNQRLPPARMKDSGQTARPAKEDDEKPEAGDYGDELAASVTSPAPGLLLVQEHFGIMCGEDNVLLGYSNASGRWKRVLRWQAPPYKEVSGAFGDWYETRLLEPQRNGHPVLLVLHGTPWCTSTMSSFAVDTLEVNPDTATDKAFFHASHDYRRADDDPPASLKVTPDGFEVRASVNDWDTGRISRQGVMRYRMVGDTLQRTLPIAMNAPESVNEWVEMRRDEAALFTDAPANSPLWRMMWQTTTYDGPGASNVPFMSYGDVRACTDSPKHYQVEIRVSVYAADSKKETPETTYYVQVEEAGNGYMLQRRTDIAESGVQRAYGDGRTPVKLFPILRVPEVTNCTLVLERLLLTRASLALSSCLPS